MRGVVEALTCGVVPKEMDWREAKMQARELSSVLRGTRWLTATQVGTHGGFSKSNPSAPANRWKNEKRLFAIEHEGQDRFSFYAFDESYRPLPAMQTVLGHLGEISSWRIAT